MSTYEISKSSLLSLKAEILRKQQEVSKVKIENEGKIKTLKKSPLEIKNKGVEARDKHDQDDLDQDLLKQSKSALEYKAELYEKLSSGVISEEDKRNSKLFLVQFDKKSANKVSDLPSINDSRSDKGESESDIDDDYQSDEDENQDPGEKWIDYVDCFGRTRRCMQKDLQFLKSKDEELKQIVEEKNQQHISLEQENNNSETYSKKEDYLNTLNSDKAELMSSDMRRELLREQWEKEEQEMLNKTDVHYQDVLFGEARSHGVGYYGFSKDEGERRKQQDALKNLRKETEEKQKKAQELKESREKLLAARLKAARNRKRARMGLPPEEDEVEPVVSQPEISEEELKKRKEQGEKERILEESRKNHIRPWDIGKEGVKEHQVMSQQEWVEQQREERPAEFAPPTNYRKNFRAEGTPPNIEMNEPTGFLNFTTNTRKHFPTYKTRPKRDTKQPQINQLNEMKKLEQNEQSSDGALEFVDTLLQDYIKVTNAPAHSNVNIDKINKSSRSKTKTKINDNELEVARRAKQPNAQEYVDFDDTLLEDYKKVMRSSHTISDSDGDNDTLLQDYNTLHSTSNLDFNDDDSLLNDYKNTMEDENSRKRHGVEIAPPPTYDYYGPSKSKVKRDSNKTHDIQDSIEAGLKFLRKQVEDREKSAKQFNDMFLF